MTEPQYTPAAPYIKPADIHIHQLKDLVFYNQFAGWSAVVMGKKRTYRFFDEDRHRLWKQINDTIEGEG